MDHLLQLTPLLVTLAVRQMIQPGVRRGLPSGKPGEGQASVIGWSLAYLAILALALWNVWSTPILSQSWWGYVVLWGGMLLRLLSLREIGGYYAYLIVIRNDHRLIDTGPYRRLRHPLHLGLHIEMAGLALLAGSTLAWIALGLSLLALVRRNIREEQALESFFGAAYRDYRRQAWDLIDLVPGKYRHP